MRVLYLLMALSILISFAQAQPKLIFVSDLIEINAPSNVSVGEGGIVEVRVYYPNVEEIGELAGTPAALTKLTASTTLGNLTEVNTSSGELTNNSGKSIVLYTNESGVALIQIKSDEPGKANITVNAPAISDLLNMLRGNESTAYLVMNQTIVEISAIQTPTTTVTPTTVTTTTTTATTTTVATTVTTTVVTTTTTTTTIVTSTTTQTTTVTTTATTIPTTTTKVVTTPTTTTVTTTQTSPIPGFDILLIVLSLTFVALLLRRCS